MSSGLAQCVSVAMAATSDRGEVLVACASRGTVDCGAVGGGDGVLGVGG